jgi:hypothetical protein
MDHQVVIGHARAIDLIYPEPDGTVAEPHLFTTLTPCTLAMAAIMAPS